MAVAFNQQWPEKVGYDALSGFKKVKLAEQGGVRPPMAEVQVLFDQWKAKALEHGFKHPDMRALKLSACGEHQNCQALEFENAVRHVRVSEIAASFNVDEDASETQAVLEVSGSYIVPQREKIGKVSISCSEFTLRVLAYRSPETTCEFQLSNRA